ncbi:MAG: IPT/TIG domain-containing protein, partial [Planctomycetales bacterium]|nr:IPT/TIG domain-containing protein [Planctomycetales bacterium]
MRQDTPQNKSNILRGDSMPTISSVSPGSGDVSGGTPVTVTGSGFEAT